MLTPFGIEIRKLRLDKGLKLIDVAEALDVSSAFLSAIETGRKPIPPAFIANLTRTLNLSDAEASVLQRAADRTTKELRVENLNGNQRELIAAFARRFDEVPSDILDKLKESLKSAEGESPFKRKRKGLLVPPLSRPALWEYAAQIRNSLISRETMYFPIMDVLEKKVPRAIEDFYVDVLPVEEMNGDEGRVVSGVNCIILREDVYEGACRGNGRHRFTACHEFAHFLLHRNVVMARATGAADPIYRDAEWQADTFAGALLMPPSKIGEFRDAEDAAKQCGISIHAATVMIYKARKSS
jgi:Zn-dependent peptidase ImmA (M78 family)/plasmid maintenance system antidote protein VapI